MASTKTAPSKVPITLLTGFLGSGKTTTLNHILTAQHGKKLAVIENEFGEIGLDEALVKQKTQLKGVMEDNYCVELMNGCICCSVRQDLAAAITQMLAMHKSGKRHVRQFIHLLIFGKTKKSVSLFISQCCKMCVFCGLMHKHVKSTRLLARWDSH